MSVLFFVIFFFFLGGGVVVEGVVGVGDGVSSRKQGSKTF